MAKTPVSGQNTSSSDQLQTWILKVYIHCEGCKKKVYKVLQSIDGVYKTAIDAKEHKATVTGSVNGEILVQKLLKSGKHAEILPESFATAAAADTASGNSKKKKKQSNKQKDSVPAADDTEHVDDVKNEFKSATTDGSDGGNAQEEADIPDISAVGGNGNSNVTGGGKNKKNKKKKGDHNGSNGTPNGETEGVSTGNPTAEFAGASMEKLNLGPPMPVYPTPYEISPYPNYYPTPAYGVSYSTSYPSAESSYYTPPVYGYAQSHPSVYYPVPQPSSSYSRSAFDDYEDEGGEGRWCTIM